MADTVLSRTPCLSVQGADMTAAGTLKTILGPIDIHDIGEWNLIAENTHVSEGWAACSLDISSSTVSTASDIPAASWANANALLSDPTDLVLDNAFSPASTKIFSYTKALPVRWLRFRIRSGGAAISGRAYFHGNR